MAFDAFLKLDGIPGESTDSKHKDEIEVLSYSWGVAQTGTQQPGGGGGEGKANFQDFNFTSRLQKSSPKLMLACATGEHIKEAVITLRKAGGDKLEFYKVTLTEVLVSSLQQSGNADGRDNFPTESISLNFAKIKTEYAFQNLKGQVGGIFSAEFDVSKGKAG